jgi:hypothetical protein
MEYAEARDSRPQPGRHRVQRQANRQAVRTGKRVPPGDSTAHDKHPRILGRGDSQLVHFHRRPTPTSPLSVRAWPDRPTVLVETTEFGETMKPYRGDLSERLYPTRYEVRSGFLKLSQSRHKDHGRTAPSRHQHAIGVHSQSKRISHLNWAALLVTCGILN